MSVYVCMEAYSRSRNLHRNTQETQTKAERTHIFDQFEWSLKKIKISDSDLFAVVWAKLHRIHTYGDNQKLLYHIEKTWLITPYIAHFWQSLWTNQLHGYLNNNTQCTGIHLKENAFFFSCCDCVCVLCARTSIETLNYFNSIGGEKVEKVLFSGLPRSFSHPHLIWFVRWFLWPSTKTKLQFHNKLKSKSNFFWFACLFFRFFCL